MSYSIPCWRSIAISQLLNKSARSTQMLIPYGFYQQLLFVDTFFYCSNLKIVSPNVSLFIWTGLRFLVVERYFFYDAENVMQFRGTTIYEVLRFSYTCKVFQVERFGYPYLRTFLYQTIYMGIWTCFHSTLATISLCGPVLPPLKAWARCAPMCVTLWIHYRLRPYFSLIIVYESNK